MTEPDFTFDVSRDAKRFLKFIEDLRKAVRDVSYRFVVHNVYRLTPRTNNPGTIDIVLHHRGDNWIRLRVRTDDLYVIGFTNSGNRWFEFRHETGRPSMIPRSFTLAAGGGYTNGDLGDLNQEQVILGWQAVIEAIDGLAILRVITNRGGIERVLITDTHRAWLRALVVNFMESIRFHAIANRVDQVMNPSAGQVSDRQLTRWDILLIRWWGRVSEVLFNWASRNPGGPNPFPQIVGLGFQTAMDVGNALAMAKLPPISNSHRQRRSTNYGIVGVTLVEIDGVLINDIDGENPGDLYGTISITDASGTVNLFNRSRYNTQSVGPGGWADLTLPSVAIYGADDFVIEVDLMDYDTLSPNDEVACGQVTWNSNDALSGDYDKISKKQINGQYGSVEVHFAVLTGAVVGTVQVVVIDGDSEEIPDVYGEITASTNMADSGRELKYKLFCMERGNSVGVPEGAAIPLQRNVISAPLCSVLNVSADLWDADRVPDLSPDDHIANGSLTFTPRLDGKDYADIKGPCGRVRVYVTWSI